MGHRLPFSLSFTAELSMRCKISSISRVPHVVYIVSIKSYQPEVSSVVIFAEEPRQMKRMWNLLPVEDVFTYNFQRRYENNRSIYQQNNKSDIKTEN